MHQGEDATAFYVIVDGKRRTTGAKGNLPFRGVGPNAMETRQDITIAEGRMFTPGVNEELAAIRDQLAALEPRLAGRVEETR